MKYNLDDTYDDMFFFFFLLYKYDDVDVSLATAKLISSKTCTTHGYPINICLYIYFSFICKGEHKWTTVH